MSELLTLAEVAARAHVTPAAVSNWRRRYAATFPGGSPEGLFRSDEVDAWLATHRARSVKQPQRQAQAFTLLEQTRDLLDLAGARAVVLSLITLHHLAGGGSDSPGQAMLRATRLEDEGLVSRGALTIPLARALVIPAARWMHLEQDVARVLTTSDVAGVFDELLERTVSAKFDLARTSSHLAAFLVSLMPDKVESVLDPACGMGTVLISATRAKMPEVVRGYEIQQETWALCCQRMIVNGLTAEVLAGDSFDADERGFDVVIVDPPLGIRFSEGSPARARLAAQGIAGASAGDFAWPFAARDALAAGGTAIVVTTMGPTFASGPSQTARHELLRSGSVEAVIALPAGLGESSGLSLAVWILRPPGTVSEALLVNAANRPVNEDVLSQVTAHYQRWRRNPHDYQPAAGFTAVRPVLELLAGEVALTPAKWTEVPADPTMAIAEATTKLSTLRQTVWSLQNLSLVDMQLNAGARPDLVSLHDLARTGRVEIQRARHIRRDDLHHTGRHPVVTGVTSEGRPRIAGYLDQLPDGAQLSQPGDVLLSTLGQVQAIVDRNGGLIPGSSVWLIRPLSDDPRTAPDLLALLLSSPRIAEQQVGSTVQRLRHPRDVSIPSVPVEVATAAALWAKDVMALKSAADKLSVAAGESLTAVAGALDAGLQVGSPATRQGGADRPDGGAAGDIRRSL